MWRADEAEQTSVGGTFYGLRERTPEGWSPRARPRGRLHGRERRAQAGLLTGALALVICAFCATDAAALIMHLPGKTLSYEPSVGNGPAQAKALAKARQRLSSGAKAKNGKSLKYNGGPVMASNTNYTLYWAPSPASEYPAGYETGIDRYFEDLAHDSGGVQNTDSVLTQYGDAAGELADYDSHFGGALIDTDPYPADGCSVALICFTDQQLRTEIAKYVEAHGLPTDLGHEYFLLTPPGVESCFEAAGHVCSAGAKHGAYCAYHGYIALSKGVIVYANDPYVAGLGCDVGEQHPNGNPSDATIGGGLAHEHSESVTDPELDAWHNAKEEEVGDVCRTFEEATEYGQPLGTAPDGAKYNQVIDGDLYYYQQMWSNEDGGCEQRSALPPTIEKVTPRKGPAGGNTSVVITGTHFTAPVTVEFEGTPATEVTIDSPTSMTVVSPAGAAGTTVNIIVTNPYGTSAVTKKDTFKYTKAKKT